MAAACAFSFAAVSALNAHATQEMELAQSTPARTRAHSALEETIVAAEINGQSEKSAIVVLRDAAGAIWLGEKTLARWRIALPNAAATEHDGERYFPLTAIPGAKSRFDSARQLLTIDAPPLAFGRTELDVARRALPTMTAAGVGVFANYDLSVTKPSAERASAAGLFELGVFGPQGVLTSTGLARSDAAGNDMLRLETTYTRDNVAAMRTVRVGDTVSRPGTWGRSLRLGGVQFGTNFATQPGFIRSPLLNAAGQAALPSVVDVFVNNTFVTRREVPPGPFNVGSIPPIAGPGTVNIVVTDILGRQQVLSQPFFASAALLARGVSDFSFEAGAQRERFAQASNQYGEGVTAGLYRYGLNDATTLETRGEFAASARAAGGGFDHLITPVGVIVSAHGAASDSNAGRGGLGLLGAQYQGGRVNVSARAQWTSDHFRQIGLRADESPFARSVALSGGLNLAPYGSLSAAAAQQIGHDGAERRVYSSTYSYQLGRYGFVSIAATRSLGSDAVSSVFLLFSFTFDQRTNASLATQLSRRDHQTVDTTTATLQRALPVGDGWGYRVLARDNREAQAQLTAQNRVGTYSIEAAHGDSGNAVRANVSGGVGYVGGHAFASRALTDSFAVVHVPDAPNVRIARDNQTETATDARGYAVVTRLRAFEPNRLSIDARDVPLDARVDALRMEIVPPYRAGIVVPFPVKRERSGVMEIMLADGEPIPAGATVQLNGGIERFPVAYRGQAFVSGLTDKNVARVEWRGSACEIALGQPPANEPVFDYGVVRCDGVTR